VSCDISISIVRRRGMLGLDAGRIEASLFA
jgi:hypothetical protein